MEMISFWRERERMNAVHHDVGGCQKLLVRALDAHALAAAAAAAALDRWRWREDVLKLLYNIPLCARASGGQAGGADWQRVQLSRGWHCTFSCLFTWSERFLLS